MAWAAAAGAAPAVKLEGGPQRVGPWQRVEFVLKVAGVEIANPFDPEQADLWVEVAGPAGRVAVPAFWYQPFEYQRIARGRGAQEWFYPQSKGEFRARYAPPLAGRYTATAILKGRGGEVLARSAAAAFECDAQVAGADGTHRGLADLRGCIRVSKSDPRYYEFDDGTPAFLIGQNVAFIKDSSLGCEMIARIGQNQGNFARVWACGEDWAMAVEARKSAWTRSWSGKGPIVPVPGAEAGPDGKVAKCVKVEESGITCSPTWNTALKPGTKYRLAGRAQVPAGAVLEYDLAGARKRVEGKRDAPTESVEFAEDFTAGPSQQFLQPIRFRVTGKGPAYLASLSLKEAGRPDAPEILWDADLNRPAYGVYNQVDAYMMDRVLDAAERAGVFLEITWITRNQYMDWLKQETAPDYDKALLYAKKLARYFAARWGYSKHVQAWEFFNEMDPGKATGRFYTELADYFDTVDVNRHPRSNSTWHAPSKDYRHPKLSQADMHFYLRPNAEGLADKANGWKDAVTAVQSRWQAGTKAIDPASPRPLIMAEFGITDEKWARGRQLDSDTDFLHWHDAMWTAMLSGFAGTPAHWYWDDVHKRDAYRLYRPVARFAADIPWTTARFAPAQAAVDQNLRVLGLAAADGRRAYLFVSDPRATWYAVTIDNRPPEEVHGATVTLANLPAGAAYSVEWWDTTRGEPIGPSERLTATAAGLVLKVPTFKRDVACKLTAK